MTTGKTIALTRWTFVGKVMSLLFNMPSRLVIAFLPRSKCLNFTVAITTIRCTHSTDPRELDYSWLESVPNSYSQLRMSSATSGHHNCGFPINKLPETTSQTSQTHQNLDQHIGWRRKNVGWDETLWSQLLNRSSHSVSNPEVCIPSCKRDLEWVVQGWNDSAMKSSRNQVPLSSELPHDPW